MKHYTKRNIGTRANIEGYIPIKVPALNRKRKFLHDFLQYLLNDIIQKLYDFTVDKTLHAY